MEIPETTTKEDSGTTKNENPETIINEDPETIKSEDPETTIKEESDIEEDLQTTLQKLKEDKPEEEEDEPVIRTIDKPPVTQKPVAIDDFIRNFFVKNGLKKSLEMFQNEWYELTQRGDADELMNTKVPEIYLEHQHLLDELKNKEMEYERARKMAE